MKNSAPIAEVKKMNPYPKPKKSKRTERKALDDECMEYLKQIVRLRDKTCVTPSPSCGGYPCNSHWQKRGKQKTRYSLENCNLQCSNHNQRHNHYTGPYDAYMLRHYGYDVCLKLAEDASLVNYKHTIPELRDIRDGLRAEYESLLTNQPTNKDTYDTDRRPSKEPENPAD